MLELIRMSSSMASLYKALLIWVQHFLRYLVYELFLRPKSWRRSLYIYLLSFPRFWTLSVGCCFDFYFDLFWMAWHWKPIEDIGGNFASAKSSPGVNLHEKCRTPHSSLTWIDCKVQKHISSLTCDCTDRRPTEESNAQSLLLFWSLAGPYQFERKLKTDVHGLPMWFLWTPKPTTRRLKPFNIHTVPRATLRGGGVGEKKEVSLLKGEARRLLRKNS